MSDPTAPADEASPTEDTPVAKNTAEKDKPEKTTPAKPGKDVEKSNTLPPSPEKSKATPITAYRSLNEGLANFGREESRERELAYRPRIGPEICVVGFMKGRNLRINNTTTSVEMPSWVYPRDKQWRAVEVDNGIRFIHEQGGSSLVPWVMIGQVDYLQPAKEDVP